MKQLSAQETLQYLIELLLYYLEDLKDIQDNAVNRFAYGEKTAYTECLEAVQRWEEAVHCGLDFNIEARFPL